MYASKELGSKDGPIAVFRVAIAAARHHRFKLSSWITAWIVSAALYAGSVPPSYTSTATLLLEPRHESQGTAREAGITPQLDTARAESEMQIIKSERLLSTVFKGLNLSQNPDFDIKPAGIVGKIRSEIGSFLGVLRAQPPNHEEVEQLAFFNFADRVGIRRIGQSYVVEVSYSSSNPSLSRRVANATLSAYLLQSVAAKADAARNGSEFLQGRVNALAAQADAAAAAVSNGSLPVSAIPDADGRIIGAAQQPLRPSAPRTGLIIALGAMLGIISGIILIAIATLLDRRIWTVDDLNSSSNIPCLSCIPYVSQRRLNSRDKLFWMCNLVKTHPTSDFSVAIRDLRTSLMLAFAAHSNNTSFTVAFVSWTRGTGCTSIIANLGSVLHESKDSVILVDADLDNKSLSLTDLADSVGFSLLEALRGDTPGDKSLISNFCNLDLVISKPNDGVNQDYSYIGSPIFTKMIDSLRSYSNVLVDSSPLSDFGDTRATAVNADFVVFVAKAGRTSRDEVSASLQALRDSGANVIGTVLNHWRVR